MNPAPLFILSPLFIPRGCPAQAWSVAEVLRSYYEDVLNRAPAWPHEKPLAPTPAPALPTATPQQQAQVATAASVKSPGRSLNF